MKTNRTWTDKQLIDAVASSSHKKEIFEKLGLKPNGNYKTIDKWISKLKIDCSHIKTKKISKYPKNLLEVLAKESVNLTDMLRKLGHDAPSGSMRKCIQKTLIEYEIDISHFKSRKKNSNEILINGSKRRLHRRELYNALIESKVPYFCQKCGLPPEWNSEKLVLHIDHIDGNWENNEIINLRFLCPNCHSQTPTFGAKNIKTVVKCSYCKICNTRIGQNAVHCRICNKHVKKHSKHTKPKITKINWPEDLDLIKMIESSSYTTVAKNLGVSDNAIRKRLKTKQIPLPKTKYSHINKKNADIG